MVLALDSKRRLTLPKDLVEASPGEYFEAVYNAEDDEITFRRLPLRNDWLAVLAQCPASMDDLPARSRRRPKRVLAQPPPASS
jgi:hypothetical protein